MKAAWVAGSVRARLLVAERRLGRAQARALAEAGSLGEALVLLGRTAYRHDLRLELGLAGAQRAVAATLLLHLRLLAGWLPRDAIEALRALGAWFELANLEDRLGYLHGRPLSPPFELGSLAVAWPRAARAQTAEELSAALAASVWGDPGGATASEWRLGLRLAWARRVLVEVPEAREWAAGALALLLARELFVAGRPVDLMPEVSIAALGTGWTAAGTFARFVETLPPQASWALDGVETPDGLWGAEAAWWARVERDAAALLRGSLAGREVAVGAVALLAADARWTEAALAAAGRAGLRGVEEALDAAG